MTIIQDKFLDVGSDCKGKGGVGACLTAAGCDDGGGGGGGNKIVSENDINKTKPPTCPYPANQAPLILLSNAPRPPTPHTQRHIKDYGQSSAPSNNGT
jgi:hypothetical protein